MQEIFWESKSKKFLKINWKLIIKMNIFQPGAALHHGKNNWCRLVWTIFFKIQKIGTQSFQRKN